MNTTTENHVTSNQPAPQALYRPTGDRMLAGVAAGIARYLGIDAALVRIAFIALLFAGGAGLPLYLAGWLLMPEEGSDQSIASGFLGSRRGGGPVGPARPN